VFSIERIAALAWQMRHRIDRLKLYNIQMRHSDGKIGWRANAPFDAILVAAASAGVAEALKEQLKVGGRLVIPVGNSRKQRLLLITRGFDGFSEECLDAVTFVPLLEGVG
jgi:protein-L-isoaspartate(D-aspartate) O-methyltransferase